MRRSVAVAALFAVGLAVTGCSGDRASDSPPTNRSPSITATADPTSPFVVAASAVGVRSREQVVALHAMGVGTTVDGGVPHAQLPGRGAAIRAALVQQIQDASRLPPQAGSPAARLIAALSSYATLAGRLAEWPPAGAGLSRQWFTTLRATDLAWRSAMTALSGASGHDLLAGLPPLIEPRT